MAPDPHPPHRRPRRLRLRVAVQHVDFQAVAFAQQPRGHTGTEQAPAQAVAGLPDQHQAGPPFGGMLDQRAHHFASTQQYHLPAQALGQLLGRLQALARGFVAQAAVVHVHQAPGQVAALRHAAGMAHQTFRLIVAIHAHQQAPTQGRGFLAALAIAVGQVGIHLGGGGLHGQFAQGGKVGLREERIDGGPRLLGHVHLAFAQAFEQLPGWQVDQHQLEGFLQHPVRQGFAYLHAGDVADLVVEAFQVLDVDRGVHIDAVGQQFLYVLPAFGVAAAGRIGVGQFVDQHQGRRGLEQAVEVHFLEGDAAILAAQQGLLLKASEQYLGFGAAMGFDHPGQHLHALALLGVGGLEHGEGLADAGGGAKEHLQPPPAASREGSQQRVCAGGVTHLSSFAISSKQQIQGQTPYLWERVHPRMQ
ncbi:hypothetical protein D3C81_979920 [compost metagenome]